MFALTHAVNDMMDEFKHEMYDQHFGVGLDEVLHPRNSMFHLPVRSSSYVRPWRQQAPAHSGVSTLNYDKDGFKVNLDVQQFKPEELKVKVQDNHLIVEARHDERTDHHGYISRQFTRRYKLPKEVNMEALVSSLSSDGVLSLHAPKKAPVESNNVREIPITHTNVPALKIHAEAHSTHLPVTIVTPAKEENSPSSPKKEEKVNGEKMEDN